MPPHIEEKFNDGEISPNEEIGKELEVRTLTICWSDVYSNLKHLDYSKVAWRNVILFVVLHAYAVYGLYLAVTDASWKTCIFAYTLYICGGLGITMGAHRLWAHKTYKATFIVRFWLMILQTMAFQNSIHEWSRDHRGHHKHSETDADPHNAKRGLFFAHMGWLMYKKHPDVIAKGKKMDMSDLLADPLIRFQMKYYLYLVFLISFIIPTIIPMYFWGEGFVNSLFVASFLRYTFGLHATWLVNSLAHWVGDRPYDKTIYPVQNRFVAIMALGEGWHNYHHVFPYDYRTAEFGGILNLNYTSAVIKFLSHFGLTYDLRTVDESLIAQRMQRTGSTQNYKVA